MKQETKTANILKIYLADLVYDTVKTNYVVPLNVAYIAAFIKEKYANKIEVKIFKYPGELEKALKEVSPDILGLSNYSWNERLNHSFLKLAKRLKSDIVTVMGGPNIRTDHEGIKEYLSTVQTLDYYILFAGEEPFGNLVEQLLRDGTVTTPPRGCAGLVEGQLHFEPLDLQTQSEEITNPSPYLSGFLDSFLTDPTMIPLFESNRGCPFGCTYCTWGIAALSKLRKRPLEMVCDELDYVARKSAKQVTWIFCDANFGILERDVEIAHRIRSIMDRYGFPINVTLWHSKNTSQRNIEIAKAVRDSEGYIAIQSADPDVLQAAGRGNIKLDQIMSQIDFFKNNGMQVMTDILIGLPKETSDSHLKTLMAAFDMGFGNINPINIRMLPGSQYESREDRLTYGIKTKYRPIFGAYGVVDGQRVFEVEESVRATKDMTEAELDSFKILHWLVYFCWNIGFCKSILRFAQDQGINPALVLFRLRSTEQPLLSIEFNRMKLQSMTEWMETKEEAVAYYEKQEHFDAMVHNFVKLNPLWIAEVFQNPVIISSLFEELLNIVKSMITDPTAKHTLDALAYLENNLICVDLLQDEFRSSYTVAGNVLSYVMDDASLAETESFAVEVYRTKEDVDFCNYYLNSGGTKDFSIQNLTRFIEMGGNGLKNRIRLVV
jgi:radical SAM superfamily enzyme YgiQ (UPF0313 family)